MTFGRSWDVMAQQFEREKKIDGQNTDYNKKPRLVQVVEYGQKLGLP